MKKILQTTIVIYILSFGAKAQIVKYGTQNNLLCTITFAYDGGGNRISRDLEFPTKSGQICKSIKRHFLMVLN
jgi:hypothetical protein